MSTKPEVFVIESLDPDDEGNGRFEGNIISQILNMHGKKCKYRYVRTRNKFIEAVEQFGKSNYRYLHISCHADPKGMCMTNQDEINHAQLGRILRPYMKSKRLFLSACEMVNDDLASEIIPHSGCNSVIGPREKVKFSSAAIFWSSLYHLMFSHRERSMGHGPLLKNLKLLCLTFRVDMSYFSKSRSSKNGYSRDYLSKNDL